MEQAMGVAPYHMPSKQGQMRTSQKIKTERILIFSPDADLANSLKLLLEECCDVALETRLDRLEQGLRETSPTFLLVDLFSTAQDGLSQLLFLERLKVTMPVILMRTYRSSVAIDDAIKRLGAHVFYKPVNVEAVVDLVQELKKSR